MTFHPRDTLALLKQAFSDWSDDKAPRLAAALAYYMAFSIAPILVIAISLLGFIYGPHAAQTQVLGQIDELVGRDGGNQIREMIVASALGAKSGIVATVVGVVTLLFGASGVFGELQDSLNTIWEVKPRPEASWLTLVRQRFFSFTMVLGTAFILLVSLVVSALVSNVSGRLLGASAVAGPVLMAVNFVVGLAVTTGLFGLIFKVVPDIRIDWRDVWVGAAVTAVLFSLGRLALGWYLGRGSLGSTFGAAGSLIIVLFWIYYSAQILFFGAEFTQAWATRYGSRAVAPAPHAEAVTAEERIKQGLDQA